MGFATSNHFYHLPFDADIWPIGDGVAIPSLNKWNQRIGKSAVFFCGNLAFWIIHLHMF